MTRRRKWLTIAAVLVAGQVLSFTVARQLRDRAGLTVCVGSLSAVFMSGDMDEATRERALRHEARHVSQNAERGCVATTIAARTDTGAVRLEGEAICAEMDWAVSRGGRYGTELLRAQEELWGSYPQVRRLGRKATDAAIVRMCTQALAGGPEALPPSQYHPPLSPPPHVP